MDTKEQLTKWLSEISRWKKVEDFVLWLEDKSFIKARLYTKDHCYSIVFHDNKEGSYLGCTVTSRKPRAGENHNRGNDLADGKFSYETWQKIKNDILAYELVKIVKRKPPISVEK